jgi:hypothetical protein
MRVFGWQTHMRNESEHRWDPHGAPSTGLDFLMKDLSKSIYAGTRKMVNYA